MLDFLVGVETVDISHHKNHHGTWSNADLITYSVEGVVVRYAGKLRVLPWSAIACLSFSEEVS